MKKIINTKKGFTLIELLVVVAIISLLAAVIIAGLSDARGGAKNSVRNETARQYVIALGLYQGEYGQYPEQGPDVAGNTTPVCLGSYPSGCFVIGASSQNSTINTQISEFAPGLPTSLETTTVGGNDYRGITYKCIETDCLDYELAWILEGTGSDAQCFGGAKEDPIVIGGLKFCKYSTRP